MSFKSIIIPMLSTHYSVSISDIRDISLQSINVCYVLDAGVTSTRTRLFLFCPDLALLVKRNYWV